MKKISRILTLVLALVLAVAGAGAEMATWQEVGTKVAPLAKAHGQYTDWDLETKLELVQLLEDLGELYDIDEVGTLLGEESDMLDNDQKNALCDQIMSQFVGGRVETVTLNSILETLHGNIGSWTMRDRKWYSDLLTQTGLETDTGTNYVLPDDNELSQDKATERALNFLASMGAEYLDECRIDATLSEEPEDVYDEWVQTAVAGRRIWTIIFDPGKDEKEVLCGGVCKVRMLASGPVVEYQTPELTMMHMTGLLAAADGVSKEKVLAVGKEALSEKTGTPVDDLPDVKAYFGYINSKDEVVAHAPFGSQLWVVHCALHMYAMIDVEGNLVYIQSYDSPLTNVKK